MSIKQQRTKFYCLLITSLILLQTNAQTGATADIQNLYNQNYRYITWLGLDFSKVIFVGDFSEALGVGGDAATKNAYFKAWNNLITGEFEKYSVKALVHNQNVTNNLQGIMNLNYAAKVDDLSGYAPPAYTREALQQHINSYTLPTDKGLGVFMLIECFDKTTNKAAVDFVVINMASKQIVILKKIETTPRGGGLRNYWAGAIYEAFKEGEKKFAKEWKNEFNLN